jgi:hypothetical protein
LLCLELLLAKSQKLKKRVMLSDKHHGIKSTAFDLIVFIFLGSAGNRTQIETDSWAECPTTISQVTITASVSYERL